MLVMVSCDLASIRLGLVCWLPQAEAKFGRQSTARSFLAENYVRVLRILKHPNRWDARCVYITSSFLNDTLTHCQAKAAYERGLSKGSREKVGFPTCSDFRFKEKLAEKSAKVFNVY